MNADLGFILSLVDFFSSLDERDALLEVRGRERERERERERVVFDGDLMAG